MDSMLAFLAPWMSRQRWYGGKGREPSLRLEATWELASPAPAQARVLVHRVADEATLPAVTYQIPIVERETAAVDIDSEHVIGSPVPGTTLIDGPFDPAFTAALEALITRGGGEAGIEGTPIGEAVHAEPRTASVLAGEQSNTSIVYRGERDSMICKVYRQVHAGLSPDIELSAALSAAGSIYVPRAIGFVSATRADPRDPAGTWSGSLAFGQEFLADVEDAWRVALRAAAEDRDFTAEARSLGNATADVHRTLAELFPTRPAGPDDRAAVFRAWERRLSIAVAEVSPMADLADAVHDIYDAAGRGPWPALQRIHGDLHLGQVLEVADHGCVLLDFEGEPMRPMRERTEPDLALRDVAGVLRSLDYVVGSLRVEDGRSPESMQSWARHTRRAFLDGYSAASGADVEQAGLLLVALELDKAVYECIYEARKRPEWLGIPFGGVERLLARAARFA